MPSGYIQLFAADSGTASINYPLFTPWSLSPTGRMYPNFNSLAGFLAANPGWQNVATTRFTSLAAGVFGGGTVTITGVSPAGDTASYFMIAWTGNYTTFDAAMTAALANGVSPFFNMTPVLTTATGNPLATPPGAPVNLSLTFPANFTLGTFVPEPGTFTLAGLGVAVLLVLRRRK